MRKIIITLLLCCLAPSLAFGAPLRACLIESTGAVVIKKKCNESKGQIALSASVLSGLATSQVGPKGDRGPIGPQGPQGVQGAVGPQGPVGPSDVLVATNDFVTLTICSDNNLTSCPDAALLTLSEGDWLLIAKFNLDSNTGFPTNTGNRCGLMQDGVKIDEIRTALNTNNLPGQGAVVTLMQTVSGATTGTEVSVRCEQESGESLYMEDLVFSALKVGAVTVQ